MLETATFPVSYCPSCARDVVVARDLDVDEQWVEVCTRCSGVLPSAASTRRYGASSVVALGYAIEGYGEGCGSGGCGSCGSSST